MKNAFETLAVLISRPTQTVLIAKDLVLHLSALEIYPDDPGMGTPMLFEDKRSGETMTWACGFEGGNLCEIVHEARAEVALKRCNEIEAAVSEWESYHWDVARKAAV